MTIDKKIAYDMQGGVRNYLGKQKTVSDVPLKWKSGPDKPATELAYITKAEKDLLLKKDIHGSLKGGPNKGPGGIISLDSAGDKDGPVGGYSGADVSAAETGKAVKGMSAKDLAGFRAGAISAGARAGLNETQAVKDQVKALQNKYGSGVGTIRSGNIFTPSNILSGLGSLIKGPLGLATKAFGFLGNKFQNLRGYNPDGTPRTQEEYEKARFDRQIQNRIDDIMERQRLGKTFSQKNLDNLLGRTDMYGNKFSPSTAQNVLTGRDLKGFTPSRMGLETVKNQPTMMEEFYSNLDNRVTGSNIVPDASDLALQIKTFNTPEALMGITGATEDKLFGGKKLSDQGKILEDFRKSAVNFKKAEQNTANTPQAALDFMTARPGLFSDIIENKDFIQSAIDLGFLSNPSDYEKQLPLDEIDLKDGGLASIFTRGR